MANRIARRRGGHREPETHLITLALPLVLGVLGTVLFGYAGQEGIHLHWMVSFFSIFLVALSVLAANTIIAVYAVESYPQIPGYVSPSRCRSFTLRSKGQSSSMFPASDVSSDSQ